MAHRVEGMRMQEATVRRHRHPRLEEEEEEEENHLHDTGVDTNQEEYVGYEERLVDSYDYDCEEEDDDEEDNSFELDRKGNPDQDGFVEMEAGEPHRLSEFAEGPPHKTGPCNFADVICCWCFSRVGNMHVLFETKKNGLRRLWCVVGPFWPCTLFVTYPLLSTVAFGLGYTFSLVYPLPLVVVWYIVAIFCLVCLGFTACSDPGIVRRESKRPDRSWVWTKQTSSFRPPKSIYCRDCNCAIEEYDHVCPWTGTAIGKKNMCCFQAFVSSCAIMFVLAIFVGVVGSFFVASNHTHSHGHHRN